MSWKHWTAVVLVIGLGIVLQMRGHDETMEEHQHTGEHQHASPATAPATASDAPAGPYRTVALEVTGMT